MKIAVCDDEEVWVNDVVNILKQNDKTMHISTFTKFEELLQRISNGEKFDIVFMDIEWNADQNGIDYGRELYIKSPSAQVIYITGYNDRFSQQIFLKPSNLCGYLLKPIDAELLNQLLMKAEKNKREAEKNRIVIHTKKNTVMVSAGDIIYLESAGHKLTLHTYEEDIICYEKMDAVMEKLPSNFARCHKSYGVNMDYVYQLKGKKVIISDTCEVPISRSKYMEFRKRYFDYIGDEV